MTLSTETRAEIERDLAEIAEPNQDQLLEAVAAGDSARIIQALTELVNASRDKADRLRRLLQQETSGPSDTERLDALEKVDCWIGLEGEFDLKPIYTAGGRYRMTVREAADSLLSAQP